MLAFSRAIWTTRNTILYQSTPQHVEGDEADQLDNAALQDDNTAAQQIAIFFLKLRKDVLKPRTKRDRSKEKRQFLAILGALPKNALRAFTDGSAYRDDNPRSGSGYVITSPTAGPLHYHSSFIGIASNNVAELKALTLAVKHLTQITRQSNISPPRPVHIFLDNLYAKNIGEGRWSAKSNFKFVDELLEALNELRALTSTSLFWVPAHADIFENEIADRLAKRGANGNSSDECLPQELLDKLKIECKTTAQPLVGVGLPPPKRHRPDHL